VHTSERRAEPFRPINIKEALQLIEEEIS